MIFIQNDDALLHKRSGMAAMMIGTLPKMVDMAQGRLEVPTSSYLNVMMLFHLTALVTGNGFGRTSALVTPMLSKRAVPGQHSNLVTSF